MGRVFLTRPPWYYGRMEEKITVVSKDLERLPAGSAGRLATRAVPTVHETSTTADIEQLLLRKAKEFDTINYIYILDDAGQLSGVVSVKDVFRLPKITRVADVMKRPVISLHPHAEERRVAELALRHGFKEIPLVAKDGAFAGVVPQDEIMKVLHRVGIDRMLRRAGIRHRGRVFDNVIELPLVKSLMHRLPWLVAGLAGGLLVARFIGGFEATLEKNIVLASFIPLLVYMADAIRTQMEAYVIRDFALNTPFGSFQYFFRHIAVTSFIGAITGGMLFAIGAAAYGSVIGLVLGGSLFIAAFSSVFTGLAIPYVLERLRVDPANASGPIATIVQDAVTVMIYFSVASYLLG